MGKLWLLTLSFAIIGIGAYGGGLVTVPLMEHELVKRRELLQNEEMSQIVAIAQMTPGPIAVNAATFVGFRVKGITGALLATTVVVLPALLILVPLGFIRETVKPNQHFVRFRRGLRTSVLSLLLFAVWSYGHMVVTGIPEFIIAIGAFLALTMFEGKVHPLVVIVLGGLIGLLIF